MAESADKEAMARALRADIAAVLVLREKAAADTSLHARLAALKTWQRDRLAETYADLLAKDRYRPATRFFLEDLYGPEDFRGRDGQLARVVPALCAMLPAGAIHTIGTAVKLDFLSESLDQAMAAALPAGAIDDRRYGKAYRAVGRREDREAQIALTGEIGAALDGLTKKRALRAALVLMRKPAHAAGFGTLQDFLERGFEAFRHMGDASEFLGLVRDRERRMMARLFDSHPDPFGRGTTPV